MPNLYQTYAKLTPHTYAVRTKHMKVAEEKNKRFQVRDPRAPLQKSVPHQLHFVGVAERFQKLCGPN